ncbi:MAG: phosphatase PAP2 family protein [Limnohabitans sp.]
MTPLTDFKEPAVRGRHFLLPLLLLALTLPVWMRWFEPALFYFLNARLSTMPALLWSLLSLLGTGWCVYVFTSPWQLRNPRVFISWLCAAPLAGLMTRAGKALANNARPLGVLDPQTVHVIGDPLYFSAMPSGHTITAFAAATAIYFSLPAPRRLRFSWLFLLALSVGLSRVAVGAHWPADVAMGAVLGMVSGLFGAWLSHRIHERWLEPQSWLMRGVSLVGIYSVYVLLSDAMGFNENLSVQRLLAVFLAINLAQFFHRSFSRRQAAEAKTDR